MKDTLTFEKGLNKQADILSVPKGSYIDAVNLMRDEYGNLITETGIKQLETYFTIVLGYCVGLDHIILAGIRNNVPTLAKLNYDESITSIYSGEDLGFSSTSRVKLETKVNYRGEEILYIAGENTKLSTLNISAENIEREDLFFEYSMPKVEFKELLPGGKVKTGVYQFAARLVTSSNNRTGFSPVTGIIPVVDESPAVSRDDYDGAEPQSDSSNAISITVSGIDTFFDYIEPCVVTYVGDSNQLQIRTLALIPINSRSEVSFVYNGNEDNLETVLPTELSIDSSVYTEAKYMTQKDGTLILSGVTEYKDTTDWQAIANSIKLKYFVVEKPVLEDISVKDSESNDWDFDASENSQVETWTDVGVSTGFEDYKNPKMTEGFKTYRRGETYSFTFTPVFGATRGDSYHIPGLHNIQTDADVTTKDLGSSIALDHNYPSSFGSLAGESVRYHKMPTNIQEPTTRQSGDITYIRLLGIEAEITLDESLWKDKITGYIIGRESRSGKETVLAQGITKPTYSIEGNSYGIVPSFGNMRTRGENSVSVAVSDINKRLFTYHSPDLLYDDISLTPKSIQRIEQMSGSYKYANNGRSIGRSCGNFINCLPGAAKNDVISLYPGITTIPTQSLGESTINRGSDYSVSVGLGGAENIIYQRAIECSLLRSTSDLQRNFDLVEEWEDNEADGESEVYRLLLDTNSFTIDLYNILQESRNYYGDVYNKESYPISVVNFNLNNIDPVSGQVLESYKSRFFNGDTFISKYAMLMKDTGAKYDAAGGDRANIHKTDSMVYFYLESNNNYNYRHYIDALDDSTLPYYPKNKIVYHRDVPFGVLNYDASLGHPVSYNKQYSANNVVQPSYTKDIQQESIYSFDNRAIYSATSVEGENFDAYKLFLPGNYHDIPKQFGKITGSFVFGNDLYFHTEGALWKSFYNNLATQATSEGDVVLGNGGAFPRPSIPIISQEGGYAGCLDISSSVGTPSGRYFYDAKKSKLYYLSSGLQEVTNPSMFQYMRDTFNNVNVSLGYDFGRKRLVLSSNFSTLSFSPEFSSFTSRHDYYIKFMSSINDKDFVISTKNQIGRYDNTLVGTYYGNNKDSSLSIPCVYNPTISKEFVGLDIISRGVDVTNNLQLPNCKFDTLQCLTEYGNTGIVKTKLRDFFEDFDDIDEVSIYRVNDRFRLNIPYNIVYDIDKDIQDPTNLVTYSEYSDLDRLFLPYMRGNYIIINFVKNNNGKDKLLLNSLELNFELNNL